MLCPPCHIGTRHPSTIYDGAQLIARSNRLIGRGCVNCHSQIHGSNSPAGANAQTASEPTPQGDTPDLANQVDVGVNTYESYDALQGSRRTT